MFAVMLQILFMAVVLYAPALAFEAGALNNCCEPHDVEESSVQFDVGLLLSMALHYLKLFILTIS